ncbi:MAG: hypothetical protein LBP63_02320 [Prevotellaceae bacterium]|nr:hypothetical protein [Prevotellaceae bacterium]
MKIINLDTFHKTYENCGGGTCPKILLNEDGDALVQGLLVDNSIKKDLNVSNGEDVVFVPKNIIQEFLMQNK